MKNIGFSNHGQVRPLEAFILEQPLALMDLPTPALVIDVEAMEHNLAKMAGLYGKGGKMLRPHVKNKILAVTEVHQERCRGLAARDRRHAGTQGNDPHFVGSQRLRSRYVHVASDQWVIVRGSGDRIVLICGIFTERVAGQKTRGE